tara:strand:+ start:1359 stop:1589 length:231 start_codon:yes stop_codon:yes gene_type:complete
MMVDRKIITAEKLLSTYMQDNLKAETFVDENGNFGARFFKDNVWLADELYKGHSEQYAENAAENFVIGVKSLYIRS